MPTTFAHVVTVSSNGVIGEGADLPWSMPKDKPAFEALVKGKTIIIGHNTYEREKHRLDIHKCLVVSKHKDLHYPTYTLEQAITYAWLLNEEVLILGGASIFEETWPIVDKVYLTHLDTECSGLVKYDLDKLNGFKMNRTQKQGEIIFKQEWVKL